MPYKNLHLKTDLQKCFTEFILNLYYKQLKNKTFNKQCLIKLNLTSIAILKYILYLNTEKIKFIN